MCLGSARSCVFKSWVSGGQSPAPAEDIAIDAAVRPTGNRLSQGTGTKDRRLHMIGCYPRLELAVSRCRRILNSAIKVFGHAVVDPSSYLRWRSRLLHTWCPAATIHRNAGGGRKANRWASGQFFGDREKTSSGSITTRAYPAWWHRHVSLVMLALP